MTIQSPVTVAVIGGSGLYDFPGLRKRKVHDAKKTPFGFPSSAIIEGVVGDKRVLFLARHGSDHTLSPADVPYRANIWALKEFGAQYVLGVSAVGALTRDSAIGDIVLPDQAFGRFCPNRPTTFFNPEDRLVAHLTMGQPFCTELKALVAMSAHGIGVQCRSDGKYVCIPGPEFSTAMESAFYIECLHAITVGMTNFPEYVLAREACLPYVAIQLITDYDNCPDWHLSAEAVIEQMKKNARVVKRLLVAFLRRSYLPPPTCDCRHALDNAIATPECRLTRTREKLDFLKA